MLTIATIEADVRKRVADSNIDPLVDHDAMRDILDDAVNSFELSALAGNASLETDLAELRKHLHDSVVGFGVLQPYLDDPSIEEIWINGPDAVFVARSGVSELTTTLISDQQIKDLVERMLRLAGRRLDLSEPFVDARLPGGERLHVVISPITDGPWAVNIRKFVARAGRIADLVRAGSLTPQAARFLAASVRAGLNILIAGRTQAGKTTMIRALAGEIPSGERIVTCEEVFELGLSNRDCVAMQCRQASLEGTGEVGLRRLVKESLRMRPDRIIVGEVREAEAFDMLVALNSGLPGMSSIHANSAREAINKLCTLPLLAAENVSSAFVTPTVAATAGVVVYLTLDASGRRRVGEIAAATGRIEDGVVELAPIFTREGDTLRCHGPGSLSTEPFERAGIDIVAELMD
ncbi:CpaF family protein [Bowdeniella nasicola]|uniref:CpaF family protein n=1 Tax=Bowdeniella nasicola TaxID=208480 RepID=UPI000A4876A3